MEKISDFLKELRDRLSNPLFISFIIAWLGFNWRIVVGLIFYSNAELEKDGYKSYIDLIEKNSRWMNNFLWPLSVALFYTFIFPIIRNVIYAVQTWAKTWGDKLNLRISKSSMVAVLDYIRLLEDLKEREQILERSIKEQSKYIADNERLKTEKLEQESRNNEISKALTEYKNANYPLVLNGNWLVISTTTITEQSNEWQIQINGEQVIELGNSSGLPNSSIINFHFNRDENKIFMSIKRYEKASNSLTTEFIEHYILNDIAPNFSFMKGYIGVEAYTVEFRKQQGWELS